MPKRKSVPVVPVSYDDLFDEVEAKVCRSVARKFAGSRKMESEDAFQEAAIAVFLAKKNVNAKQVSKKSKKYGAWVRRVAENGVITNLRFTKTMSQRVMHDPSIELDAFPDPDIVLDNHNVNPEISYELEQVLEKIMLQLLRHPNGIQLVSLFQDLLANNGIGRQSNRATILRDERLKTKGSTATKKSIPNETLFVAHSVSYRQGQELFEIVSHFLCEYGYRNEVEYVKRKQCREENEKPKSSSSVAMTDQNLSESLIGSMRF